MWSVWGDGKYFQISLNYWGFSSGKAGYPPPSGQLYLPNTSLPSSNQKNLFLLNIQLVIYIKAEFALILTAKRLFLNWNWAVVQQCSFLCIMPCVSAPQPAWVQLDLLQEGPDGSCWAHSLPLPPFLLLLSFWNSNWMQFSAHLSQNILLPSFSGS